MKLVIDISKHIYEHSKEQSEDSNDEWNAMRAIADGTPLTDCTDAINREAVSSYVESHIQEINSGYGDMNSHTNRILRMITDYINSLPPVNPTTDLSKIRAEITELRRKQNVGVLECLDIIDKCIGKGKY